jgi:hypothetical protein
MSGILKTAEGLESSDLKEWKFVTFSQNNAPQIVWGYCYKTNK